VVARSSCSSKALRSLLDTNPNLQQGKSTLPHFPASSHSTHSNKSHLHFTIPRPPESTTTLVFGNELVASPLLPVLQLLLQRSANTRVHSIQALILARRHLLDVVKCPSTGAWRRSLGKPPDNLIQLWWGDPRRGGVRSIKLVLHGLWMKLLRFLYHFRGWLCVFVCVYVFVWGVALVWVGLGGDCECIDV
jgi:hypothetical protein